MPSLSIVIPTLGRDAVLLDTLSDLLDQDLDTWECLVVSQGELDLQVLRDLPWGEGTTLRVFHSQEPNASLARNIGLIEARGDIVLFLDDDLVIPDRGFLRQHLGNYEDPAIPGVAGQIIDPEGVERTTRHPRSLRPRVGWLYFPPNYAHRCTVANGGSGNLSVRRHLALRVGGMDAQFERGAHREESDFCMRLVFRFGDLVFDPEASVVHLGAGTGGCRSWGDNQGLHPLHHVTGEWYFILKNLRQGTIWKRDLPDHIFALIRRQILNADNIRHPSVLLRAVARSIRGLIEARRKLKSGPREIPSTQSSEYLENPRAAPAPQ